MLKRIISIVLSMSAALIIFGLGSAVVYAADTSAANPNPLVSTCKVPGADKSTVCSSDYSGDKNPVAGKNGILSRVVNLALIGAGIVAVIAIIVAGFEYVISAGDSAKISRAKDAILYAVIGLVIAVSAEIILKFVIKGL